MSWYELDPLNTINTAQTWRVELNGNKVDYYHDANGNLSINYGDAGLAQAAYDAWLAAVAPTPPLVAAGAIVRLRADNGRLKQAENISYTVIEGPTPASPYWALLGNQTGTTYIFSSSTEIILEEVI